MGPKKLVIAKKPASYVPRDDSDIDPEDGVEEGEEEAPEQDEEVGSDDGASLSKKPAGNIKKPAASTSTEEGGEDLLDKQIRLMKEYCKQHNVTKPDSEVLGRFLYTPSLKASAWQKLKAARGKESMSVQEAWDEISGLKTGKGKTEMKNTTLFLFLSGNPKWAERLEEQVQTISKTDTKTLKQQEFSRGELDRIHGFEETQDFIDKGKFIELEDEWGDKVYVKSTKTHTKTLQDKKEHANTRTVDEDPTQLGTRLDTSDVFFFVFRFYF